MLLHAEQLAKRTASSVPKTFDFFGRWTNELGSILEITIGEDGAVTGRFQSAVSDDGAGATDWFPVNGVASGDLITFNVNWRTEITTWIGHGVNDKTKGAQILTLWQIVKTIPDITDPEKQWKTIMAGADIFSIGDQHPD
jgi:hypothetical protein